MALLQGGEWADEGRSAEKSINVSSDLKNGIRLSFMGGGASMVPRWPSPWDFKESFMEL